MSFGFSVGDFIATASLITQVACALREAGGSASQHQHISNKLGFLDRALRDVNRLEPIEGLEAALEEIKTAALRCQLPLLKYLETIRKYDKSLCPGKSSGVMKDVLLKTKWKVSKKLEAAMVLEAEIADYLAAINLLLGLYKVKVDAATEQRARDRSQSLTTALANLQAQNQSVSANVAQVRHQVERGTLIVCKDIEASSNETSRALKILQQNCSTSISEFLKTAGTLSEVALQICSKVSEIYNNTLWIRTHLSQPDTRHTWLQEPMQWEDAYGRVFPIPAEFDYPMMEGALRGHFREGRGMKLVKNNQWQLFDPSNPRVIFSEENWEPFPGMKITMAMIIPQFDSQMVCPRLNCLSKSYTDAIGGGKICSECKSWFDYLPRPLTQENPKGFENRHYSQLSVLSKSEIKNGNGDIGFSSVFEIDEEDLRLLKNALVRLEHSKLEHQGSIISRNDEDIENDINKTVPVAFEWKQGGTKVYVTGTFFQWNRRRKLSPVEESPGVFRTIIRVSPEEHHFRFIVDEEWKFSPHLPNKVDDDGNFINWVKVNAETSGYSIPV